jgi:hypothetical protein
MPILTTLLLQEKNRQKHFINLIPSENFTSQAVLDALGSVMQSKLYVAILPSQAHTVPQTNTRKVTQARDTTAETSILTRQSVYARKEHSRPSVSILQSGVSMSRVSQSQ